MESNRTIILDEEEIIALKHAENARGMVYTVSELEDEYINIVFFGCAGSKSIHPDMVASHLNKIAEEENIKLPFAVELGDNYYPDGVRKPKQKMKTGKQRYKRIGRTSITSRAPGILASPAGFRSALRLSLTAL